MIVLTSHLLHLIKQNIGRQKILQHHGNISKVVGRNLYLSVILVMKNLKHRLIILLMENGARNVGIEVLKKNNL
jgi:hypothetical protein